MHIAGKLYAEPAPAVGTQLSELVAQYELDPANYSYAVLPADYREKMQKGITAFRLEIEKLQAQRVASSCAG